MSSKVGEVFRSLRLTQRVDVDGPGDISLLLLIEQEEEAATRDWVRIEVDDFENSGHREIKVRGDQLQALGSALLGVYMKRAELSKEYALDLVTQWELLAPENEPIPEAAIQ